MATFTLKDIPERGKQQRRCFISLSQSRTLENVIHAITGAARRAGFDPYRLDKVLPGAPLDELVVGEIARADCVVADITEAPPSVLFEIGSARAMGKPVFFVCDEEHVRSQPSFLRGYVILPYSSSRAGLTKLETQLTESLKAYQDQPQRYRRLFGRAAQAPFFVDWDRLERPDAENLCRELLAQLGFQRPDWFKESRDIDLIAELPRKDPDGFEYRELWCVSMGRNEPIEMMVDMARHDPEYFVHRILRFGEDSKRINELMRNPITLLLVILDDVTSQGLLFDLEERLGANRRKGIPRGAVRVRVWDRTYLTSLVHQFPNLGYKYFSDEGRAASKFRKTPEELYRENVDLTERQALTLRQLEEEKSLRVRAQRDSVWKDISFSAAHKLGNPIFAIETSLDPLERRIAEKRTDEAIKVMQGIRTSIEKAKAIVDQFKSLACAQEMSLENVLLKPLIEASCQALADQGVTFSVDCGSDIRIIADPGHLSECFDELIRNSLHWFDKAEKRIDVIVVAPATALPANLDTKKRYALIHFRDNGKGIAIELKSRIFDAFFSTRDHGMGLGLALVRRMVEEQSGMILESGQPGKGADFEIYVPLAESGDTVPPAASKQLPKPKRKK
jgi:signal transduction histidine kinase